MSSTSDSRVNGNVFTAYAAASRNADLAESLQDLLLLLSRNSVLRIKDASLRLFGDVTGSFIWTKTLLEHLAYLNMVGFNDQWSVSA